MIAVLDRRAQLRHRIKDSEIRLASVRRLCPISGKGYPGRASVGEIVLAAAAATGARPAEQ